MSLIDKLREWIEYIHLGSDPATATIMVRKGDTLYAIAEALTGNGERWHEAEHLNPDDDLNHIEPGQIIVIPKDWLG